MLETRPLLERKKGHGDFKVPNRNVRKRISQTRSGLNKRRSRKRRVDNIHKANKQKDQNLTEETTLE